MNEAPGGGGHASEFADQRRPARAIAGLMRARYRGFESLATSGALALLEDDMGNVHLDRRQVDYWRGVVGGEGDPLVIATGTRVRLDQVYLGGAPQRRVGAHVAFAPPAFAAGLAPFAFGSLVG